MTVEQEPVPKQQVEQQPAVEVRPGTVGQQIEQAAPGVVVQPQPDPLVQDQQVVAQPHPAPPAPEAIELPTDPDTAQAWVDSGTPEEARTWLGVVIIRKVKQAILAGKRIIVGVKQ